MAICVISQPRLFPGLHYLHRMMVADVFVIFDTVQFNPRHEENRAKIRTPKGAEWLTVTMRQASRDQLIRDTVIDTTQPWQRKAWGTLQNHYAKAPCFEQYAEEIRALIEAPHETLLDLDVASWEPALRRLGITCQFVRASELPVAGKGPRLLLDICKYLKADTYLSGGFGRNYLDCDEFADAGVEVLFHEYEYPVYTQRHGEFIPYLSYLDLLFNAGLDRNCVHAGGSVVPASAEGVAL
jgi:hypothetical protein